MKQKKTSTQTASTSSKNGALTLTQSTPTLSEVEVENPFTGEKQLMVVDHTGYTEEKLSTALANPDLTRDQKDFALSMYLYQRGAESTSLITDLFRYKGQHTKETRVFKSQIRFDFEQFVTLFTHYLEEQSRLIGVTLGRDIKDEREAFKEWLKMPNNKHSTYKDFNKRDDVVYTALLEIGMNALEEAELLKDNVRKITDARMRDKGRGIYVSADGVPYTMDDPKLDDVIKADRESTAEAKKEI